MEERARKTSAKKLETNEKYLQKLDRITIRLYKEGDDLTKKDVERHAARLGVSVNQFVIDAIKQYIRTAPGD